MAGQPTKIGKYDVIREIGRGGMGKVYGAIDPTIGRMVAIKQVTTVVSDDPDLLKRFYREAQSTGKLQHPNIVTLHDLGEQDGIPYLSEPRSSARGLFRPEAIRRICTEHRAGHRNHGNRIWLLLNLELWQRIFLAGEPVTAVSTSQDSSVTR